FTSSLPLLPLPLAAAAFASFHHGGVISPFFSTHYQHHLRRLAFLSSLRAIVLCENGGGETVKFGEMARRRGDVWRRMEEGRRRCDGRRRAAAIGGEV
ncbi:hypothetical protein A2U01_0031471, partial [Trifolium medium]|nr:hypothetical protein [Trifolium medium]